MRTWVALFRGINVGGNHTLPMAKLVRDLESINLKRVRTYIQSGNVVFQSTIDSGSQLTAAIEQCVEQQHRFRPKVLLLTREDLDRSIASNPYTEATADHKSLHFYFLSQPPEQPNLQRISELKSSAERFALINSVFYLHAPDGIGRSKLAAAVEKNLGVLATARNWRTVQKLQEMLLEMDE
jgi:uncharacterized protein (DUF1697 family)